MNWILNTRGEKETWNLLKEIWLRVAINYEKSVMIAYDYLWFPMKILIMVAECNFD